MRKGWVYLKTGSMALRKGSRRFARWYDEGEREALLLRYRKNKREELLRSYELEKHVLP